MLRNRIHILFLLLILLFNFPAPHFVHKEKGKKNINQIKTQKTAFVTYETEYILEFEEPFDSIIFLAQDKSRNFKGNKLSLRLNPGINRFQLERHAGHTVDTLQYIIYKGSKKTRISVVSGYITPIFKILRYVGQDNPDLEIHYFLYLEKSWLQLTRTGLKKVTKPDFESYNLNILLDKTILPEVKSEKKPVLLISEDETNAQNFREAFITGNSLRLRIKNIKISSQRKEYMDTLLILEPYFLPVAGRISGLTFEIPITNLYELYMQNPESISIILNDIINFCKIPQIKEVVLGDSHFLIAEPPEFSHYPKVEIYSDTERIFPKILFEGYQLLPGKERSQRYVIKTLVNGETVDSIEIITSPVKGSEPIKLHGEKWKISITLLPAQGNPTFLILFFIVTALTYTLSKSGRLRP
ncbi:MAG: hypothetical protein ABIM42_06540 [candidate division WOR-3 bacterium]